MNRREFIAGAATCAFAAPAIAQPAWPAKGRVVKIIVPFPPGAANDALGRMVAQRISEKFGVTTIVENRAGGSGLIGTKSVLQSDPDGYTLLASAFNTAAMPLVLKAADFDPETDFEVVARTATAPLVCVENASRPEKTLAEVMASAKREPGKWNIGIAAIGAPGHLASIEFTRRVGVPLTMVPYRGTQPALLDVMAGAVQLLIDASFALIPAARDGTKARALGIATAKRSILAPEIPTMSEAGMPGFEFQSWYAVWAPKGTPQDIVVTLNTLVREMMRDPAVESKLRGALIEPVSESLEDTKAFIHAEIERAAKLLHSVNFQPT
jgi:tripartite-type tricarboxylate transporter receptor subunit TctC